MDDRITAGNTVRLDPEEADRLLKRFNVPTVTQRVVYSPEPDDAVRAAEEFGYPVVLKAFTPTLVHKSDIGGVRMFLHDDHQVSRAAREIQDHVPDLIGYLLQSQAPGGHEVMIECSRRAGFGPVIQIGLGGGWAELLGDVSARIAPIDHQTARAMIDELRGAPLLYGQHGGRAAKMDGLIDMLVNLSRLMVDSPDVVQLDINPAIAGAYEVVAVDTRVFRVEGQSAEGSAGDSGTDTETAPAVRGLLSPASIAIIGDLKSVDDQSRRLISTLRQQGYTGELYPVDSGVTEVLGWRSYPTLSALPAVPDLACVLDASGDIIETVRACGELGISSALVYPHVDEERLAALRAAAVETGIRVGGPDTAGVVRSSSHLHIGLDPVPEAVDLTAGGVAILTQSASVGSWLLGQIVAAGAGSSCWIDTGREIDLTLSDYLHELADDPDTSVVAVFLESLRAPGRFTQAAERLRTAGKTLLVYRPTRVGTDGLPDREDRAFDAALRHAGAARVGDLETLADAALALAWQPVPAGSGVGLAATSGGAGRIVTAECDRHGLTLPELDAATVERIRESESPLDAVANPMWIRPELAREPGVLAEITGTLLSDPLIDALILALSPVAGGADGRVAAAIGRAGRQSGKPVLVCLTGPEQAVADSRAVFHAEHVPVLPTPERGTTTLRTLVKLRNA